jgi:hypothetical protein
MRAIRTLSLSWGYCSSNEFCLPLGTILSVVGSIGMCRVFCGAYGKAVVIPEVTGWGLCRVVHRG